jgi:hypothetical protein
MELQTFKNLPLPTLCQREREGGRQRRGEERRGEEKRGEEKSKSEFSH